MELWLKGDLLVEIASSDMARFKIRMLKRSWDSYKTGFGNFSDVGRQHFYYLYSFHLGEVVKCFLFEKGLFCICFQWLKTAFLSSASGMNTSNTILFPGPPGFFPGTSVFWPIFHFSLAFAIPLF
jgi:hypothetical protein